MNEILLNIISVVVSVIVLPLITLIGTKLIQFINKKINNAELSKQLETATNIVTNAVRSVFQTYVESLKKEGKFDEPSQKAALTKAILIAKAQLTEETKSYIEKNYVDLDNWLKIQIEATINLLKNS